MIEVDVPGFGPLRIEHLVFDYNGTLAVDGEPVPGAVERLAALARRATVHVITADTFGRVRSALAGLDVTVEVLPAEGQAEAKARYVESLGASGVAAFGNGRNDRLMLACAALGVALLQAEGASSATVAAADVLAPDILSALDLLDRPLRLVATLRS